MASDVASPKDVLEFCMIFIAPFYLYFYAILKEKKSSKELVTRLDKFHLLPFYRSRLQSLLDKLDNSLAPLSWSWRFISVNLSFHFTLALIYLVIVFSFVWWLGGSGDIGALHILPSIDSFLQRTLFLIFLILFFFLCRYLLRDRSNLFLEDMISVVVGGVLGVVVVGGVGVGVVFVVVFVGVVFVVVVGVFVGVYVGVFVGVYVGIISLLNGGDFFTPETSSIFIFLLIIPFLNALLDFLSFTISRYFFQKIAKGESIWKIMIHIILDFILAIVFFIALWMLLYFGIGLFNSLVETKLQIPIETMLTDTLKNPFGLNNLWITFMLLSTLLPTFVHLILAVISLALYVTKTAKWYALLIEEASESESKKMKASALMAIPSGLLAMVIFYIFLYLPYVFLT